MGKTVIFGGTFNPLHIGHEEMLSAINSLDSVDRILIVPTKIPPHKSVSFLASDEARLEMCNLAAKKVSKACVSDIELKREGKSYTFDTLFMLKSKYPTESFGLCIGGDMLTSFKTWYNYEKILKLAELFVFSREHSESHVFMDEVDSLRSIGATVTLIDTKITTVSSTLIRENLDNHDLISAYMSPEIINFLESNNIYGELN